MKLYNTLSRKVEEFKPIKPPAVGIYSCGLTVYDYMHIGHARTFVFADGLRRGLEYLGYKVKHVRNITDVGHLVSDADTGEDKMEKAAREKGKTPEELAEFYTADAWAVEDKLNILRPHVVCKATEHITEMIALVKMLEEKGYLYKTSDGLYFDIAKFSDYGKLGGFDVEEQQAGVRVPVREEKKHPADFAVWKFARPEHLQQWDSPWGRSFPGWHIECSAMSMKYLGESFDIHTGGVDHIQIHHNNEIAQSEAATGKKFVNYWMHAGHLHVDGKKMSKSLKNFYRLTDIEAKGIEPLALRYLFLTAQYRQTLNFTWEGLAAAQTAYRRLGEQVMELREDTTRTELSAEKLKKIDQLRDRFKAALESDLGMPEAVAVVWETVKSGIPSRDKYDLIVEFDSVLGLGLKNLKPQISKVKTTAEIDELVKKREELRRVGDFAGADQVRRELEDKGYIIEDTAAGPTVKHE